MNWKLIIVLVSAFGIIKEFRPATPFLTPYLISPPKNFTNVQLYSEVYPFWTYSYLIALIPSFFLTDLLRYKPIAIIEAVALCVTWILLLWGKTIWQMQIMQIAFGVASACELGYESYMFLIVDKKYYKLVSSYTRAATLIGRFFAYALAQFLISFNYGSYLLLNQVMNYVQSLWVTMQNISDNFNAITECINTFIGAAISFSMQYIRKDWTVNDELMLAITSIIIAILLIIMSQSKSIIIAYILYVGVIAIYNLLMTAACATIASALDSASYGFVFGLNTFIALLLETIITFAFADKHGFALSIRNQFLVYSGYFGIIGLIFIIIICWKYIMRWWRQHHNIVHNNVSSYDNNNASFSSITI